MKYLFTILLCFLPICTALGQRPNSTQIIIDEETLKGIKTMSVEVYVDGITDIPESIYRADIESRLKAAGITVLPPTKNPRTYPFLMLSVFGSFIRANDGSIMGSLVSHSLKFYQVFPQKVGSETVYIRGITYDLANTINGNSIGIASSLRESYIEQINEFVQDYKKVNPPVIIR